MRPSFRSAVLSCALLAAVSGCRLSTGPGPIEVTVAASPSRTRVPAGETVVVEAVITNASSDTAWVPGGFPAFLEVRDAAGRVVAFGRFQLEILEAFPPWPLGPGETVVDRVPWAGELNLSTVQGARAAPGVYRVRVAVPLLRRSGDAQAYSAPVTVEVMPP